jgi:hypothetical protein
VPEAPTGGTHTQERPSWKTATDPIAAALAFAIREAVRLAAERDHASAQNRRTIEAVGNMKRGTKAA